MTSHTLLITFSTLIVFGASRYAPENGAKDCENVKCENEVEFCQPGQFLVSKNYYSNDNCCNYCESYAGLGDSCSYSSPNFKLCSPSLRCQNNNPNTIMDEQPDSLFCTYQWKNYFPVKCGRPNCPTFCACPDDQKLVKADGVENCCDQCIPLSRVGEFCDEKQACLSELSCVDSICQPSSKCSESCEVMGSCPNGTYFVPRDGIDQCCDVCKPFARIGEHCDDTQNCDYSESFCNYVENVCIATPKINCDGISCSPVKCEEGTKMQPDFVTTCCEYCA